MMRQTLVFALALLSVSIGADDHQKHCYDDVDACTERLRDLLIDDSQFWFGTSYTRKCGPFTFSMDCTNPDKVCLNILARVYNATDDAKLQQAAEPLRKLNLAHVTFTSEKGSYFGCDHTYEVDKINYKLDPTVVTTVNSWTLDKTPSITWSIPDGDDANTYYTVMVWDVGYYYLHGLYVNAQGGNLDKAEVVDKYHGPRNPRSQANVFLFAVFRQAMKADVGFIRGVMSGVMAQNQMAVPAATFLAQTKTYISDMVAANILSAPGDAYAMEFQKNSYISNTCPNLITQSPVIKQVLNGANIEATWTNPETTLDYQSIPYLSTLTCDLKVEYFMPNDMTVNSCCVKTTVTQSIYRPDPLGTRTTRPILTSSTPRVKISPIAILTDLYNSVRNKYYTLLMVDLTASLSMDSNKIYVIHWLVTNIPEGDVTKGNDVLPYTGPNPFDSDAPRTYVFLLLEQDSPMIDTSNIADFASDQCPPFLKNRCTSQVSEMLKAWNLNKIVGITWFQAVQDPYARKRLYSELYVRTMVDVCDGQPGYEDPCPEKQFCASRSENSGHTLTTSGLFTWAAFYSVYYIKNLLTVL